MDLICWFSAHWLFWIVHCICVCVCWGGGCYDETVLFLSVYLSLYGHEVLPRCHHLIQTHNFKMVILIIWISQDERSIFSFVCESNKNSCFYKFYYINWGRVHSLCCQRGNRGTINHTSIWGMWFVQVYERVRVCMQLFVLDTCCTHLSPKDISDATCLCFWTELIWERTKSLNPAYSSVSQTGSQNLLNQWGFYILIVILFYLFIFLQLQWDFILDFIAHLVLLELRLEDYKRQLEFWSRLCHSKYSFI